MKSLFILFFLSLTATISAQDITGEWNGLLKVQGMQLRLVFHITADGKTYTATMDSPDQGAKGIPVTSTKYENNKLRIEVQNAGIVYEGEWKDNKISGSFQQGGMEIPMELTREKAIVAAKPQEPVQPYPYIAEDVKFENKKEGFSLAGTLTLPAKEGSFPAVILISGSGPQNRDEELLGHKPFLVIADHLTRNGIAVLRFDDRGTAESGGDFATATSFDFSNDVSSAIEYLKTRKEIRKNKIGLIGHSEGGIIAPMVAARTPDVAFIVLMAGTGISGDQLLLMQQKLIFSASGMQQKDLDHKLESNGKLFQLVRSTDDDETLRKESTLLLKQILAADPQSAQGMSEDDFIKSHLNQVMNPWMRYFLRYDPATALVKVKCPVLAINGSKDLQVPAKENLSAIRNALEKGGNKNITTKEYPGLNHLFQEAGSGLPAEYASIEQTFSPLVLEEITNWIKLQSAK